MAIGKFPGQRTAFFEAFFGEDYRTHTVPVNKYEPRMFVGKEVPEGATHYLMNEDDEYVWLAYPDRGSHNPAFYQSGSWYTLPLDAVVRGPIHKLSKEEKIMKKELTFKDLDDGIIVVGPSGDKFKLHRSWHKTERAGYCSTLISLELTLKGFSYTAPKTPEQIAYEALQAQIAEEEARHVESMKALREQAEKLKPKVVG